MARTRNAAASRYVLSLAALVVGCSSGTPDGNGKADGSRAPDGGSVGKGDGRSPAADGSRPDTDADEGKGDGPSGSADSSTPPNDVSTKHDGSAPSDAGATANQSVPAFTGGFAYGINAGYYNPNLTDPDDYQMAANAGANAERNSLPDVFLQQYGNTIRVSAFQDLTMTLGFHATITIIGAPASSDQDTTQYPAAAGSTGTVQSKLWQGMYDPIWTDEATGTVNPSNTFAVYINNVVQNYGPYIGVYEIVNEPDFTTNYASATAPAGTADSWLSSMPVPGDLSNVDAPVTAYIRILRIAYAVVKHSQPSAFVAPGGLGYAAFLDCLLRYTDNPTDGSVTADYPLTGGAYFDALTWHIYPEYDDYHYDDTTMAFVQTRYSDSLVAAVRTEHQALQAILTAHGYDGSTYPKKLEMMSEGNISRVQLQTSAACATAPGYECTGGTEIQENFTVKALVEAQRDDISGWYWYETGEVAPSTSTASSPGVSYDSLMGFYDDLTSVTFGSQVMNTQGQTHLTTTKLLVGYAYDQALSTTLALPAAADGAAFTNSSGKHIYVLWAVTSVDNSEAATATYSFPSSLGLTTLKKYDVLYSVDNTTSTVSAQNIALTGDPIFLQ